MEIVKDKHPYCPQCGRKRGVSLRVDKFGEFEDYYICCKNCHQRILVKHFGLWDE